MYVACPVCVYRDMYVYAGMCVCVQVERPVEQCVYVCLRVQAMFVCVRV